MASRSRSSAKIEAELARALDDNRQLRATIATLTTALNAQAFSMASLQTAFEEQKVALERTLAELQALQKKLFKRKTEKLPRPAPASSRREPETQADEGTRKKRTDRASRRNAVEIREHPVAVPEPKRTCPHCGNMHLRAIGDGKPISLLDYEPGRFIRTEYVLETLACTCGDYIVSAESPVRPFEQGKYGPHFIAHVIVSKLLDAIPHHRLEKMFDRAGVPMSRSTMTDLLHRAAELLAPLITRLFALIAVGEVVQADETSLRVQHREKLGFVWTFIHENLIAYRFSPDRSGDTPKDFLGDSNGILVVDAYSGYNAVTSPSRRLRAGCWAHVRRKLFESREQAPEALRGMELILELYMVEREAKERSIVGTAEHLALRRARSAPAIARIRAWLEEQTKLHPPKSQMGVAVRYALKNWGPLTVFLDDARVPVDNNRSESALRAVAIGRKNFLFVGHDKAGENIAGLLSLIATCVANGVNPHDYLADVLVRIHTHPARDLENLLPHRWEAAA